MRHVCKAKLEVSTLVRVRVCLVEVRAVEPERFVSDPQGCPDRGHQAQIARRGPPIAMRRVRQRVRGSVRAAACDTPRSMDRKTLERSESSCGTRPSVLYTVMPSVRTNSIELQMALLSPVVSVLRPSTAGVAIHARGTRYNDWSEALHVTRGEVWFQRTWSTPQGPQSCSNSTTVRSDFLCG